MNRRNRNAARNKVLSSRDLLGVIYNLGNAQAQASMRASFKSVRNFSEEVVPVKMISHKTVVRGPGARIKYIPNEARYRRWSTATLQAAILDRMRRWRVEAYVKEYGPALEVTAALRGLRWWRDEGGDAVPPLVLRNLERLEDLFNVMFANSPQKPLLKELLTPAVLRALDKVTLYILAWAVGVNLGKIRRP